MSPSTDHRKNPGPLSGRNYRICRFNGLACVTLNLSTFDTAVTVFVHRIHPHNSLTTVCDTYTNFLLLTLQISQYLWRQEVGFPFMILLLPLFEQLRNNFKFSESIFQMSEIWAYSVIYAPQSVALPLWLWRLAVMIRTCDFATLWKESCDVKWVSVSWGRM